MSCTLTIKFLFHIRYVSVFAGNIAKSHDSPSKELTELQAKFRNRNANIPKWTFPLIEVEQRKLPWLPPSSPYYHAALQQKKEKPLKGIVITGSLSPSVKR